MHILAICADPAISIRGHTGAAIHSRSLIDAWSRLGHQVTVIAPRVNGDCESDARIIAVPAPQRSQYRCPTARRALNDQILEVAANVMYTTPIDLIYERHTLWSDVGCRLRSTSPIPFVLEVNDPVCYTAEQTFTCDLLREAQAIERSQFKSADNVIAISSPLVSYAERNGADRDKLIMLPNAADVSRFNPTSSGESIRNRYQIADKKLFGFVGPARESHDTGLLIEAFDKIRRQQPDAHLLLVGCMPKRLLEQIEARGLSDYVTMTGPVRHDMMPETIAAMDVAVLPWTKSADFYHSPLTFFEYLASGVPVIVADRGQPNRLIDAIGINTTYQAGDVQALTDVMMRLIGDSETTCRLGAEGARYVANHHTWDLNAAKTFGAMPVPGT